MTLVSAIMIRPNTLQDKVLRLIERKNKPISTIEIAKTNKMGLKQKQINNILVQCARMKLVTRVSHGQYIIGPYRAIRDKNV